MCGFGGGSKGLGSQYDSLAGVLSVSHGIKISVTVGDDKVCRWINLAYAVEVVS